MYPMNDLRRTLHYIEAFDHTELALRWVPVLVNTGWRIVVHINPAYHNIFPEEVKDQIEVLGPSHSSQWKLYLQHLDFHSGDLAVVPTIGRHPHWFLPLIDRVPYCLVLHNLRYVFDPVDGRIPIDGWRPAIRVALDWLRRPALTRLLDSAIAYLYTTPGLRQFALRHASNLSTPHHLTVPFAYTSPTACTVSEFPHRPLRIVVPGSVYQRTKDYRSLLPFVENLKKANVRVDLHLAGRIVDRQVVADIEKLINSSIHSPNGGGVMLYTYPEGLSTPAFTEVMNQSDILLAPLQHKITVGNYYEITGVTKASGVVYDAVFYQKPLYVPDWFDLAEAPIFRYTDPGDLAQQIIQLTRASELPEIDYSAYSVAKQRDHWDKVLSLV